MAAVTESAVGERQYVDAARALRNQVMEAAAEGEAARCVTPEVMAAIREAGFFQMWLPEGLGGPGLSPHTFMRVIEELSYADGSTGWSTLILNGTFFLAWLEPDVAAAMLRDAPDLGVAGTFAPVGRATPLNDNTFSVDGRWTFNSGSPYAEWLVQGVMVMDGDGPRMVPPGRPDWRLAFVRTSDVEVIDTWRVAGLRGTSSNDVTATALAVPESHMICPFFEPARQEGPPFRWSFFSNIAALFVGFPLGVARRALDEITTVATTSSRSFDGSPLNQEAAVNLALGGAHAALASVRSRMDDIVGRMWDTAVAGDSPTLHDRAELRLAAIHTMRTAVDVVDTAYRLGGGRAIYETSALQRCWRDLHAGSHHVFFGDQSQLRASRALFGLPTEEFML